MPLISFQVVFMSSQNHWKTRGFFWIEGKTDLRGQLDEAIRDAGAKYTVLEETEKRSVVSALLEERSHLCLLLSCLKPVLVSISSTSAYFCGPCVGIILTLVTNA